MQKTLYVGFSSAKSPLKIGSALIRWAESPKSLNPKTWFRLWPASHVFAVFPAHAGRPFYLVNEAAGTSVRWVSQVHFEDHAKVLSLYAFKFDSLNYSQIKLYGELHAGAPYAFMENVGIGVVRIVKILSGRTIANPFGAGDGIQKCSELVLRNVVARVADLHALKCDLLNERGHELPDDVDNVGVRDIFEVLEYLADHGRCERLAVDQISTKVA